MRTFGELILEHRKRFPVMAGEPLMSRAELARRAEVDPGYLSSLEKNIRHAGRNTVHKIAEALHLKAADYDALLVSAGYQPSSLRTQMFEPLCADLDDIIAASPEDLQEDIRGSLRMLIRTSRIAYQDAIAA